MRIRIAAVIFLACALGACSRRDDNEPAARQAGREAHEAARKAKEAAEKAGQKLREAARQAREGWNEADRQNHTKEKPGR